MWCRLLAVVSISLGFAPGAGAEVIRVHSGATGQADGRTWIDAHTDINSALSRANAGDELWVAAGTYEGPFALKAGVRVLGGFAGTETDSASRSPAQHRTILTGRDRHRVVTSDGDDAGAVLDGFRITGGFVDIPVYGGAMELRNSHAAFTGCDFVGNRAETVGGVVVIWGGSPRFERCRFLDNTARAGCGAVFNREYGSPTFVDCLFVGNRAMDGGAVCSFSGAAKFVHCTFGDNVASTGRGAALFDVRGEASVEQCVMWNGSVDAPTKGQVYCHPEATKRTLILRSDIQGGWPGEGNADANPKFVNPGARDFSLTSDSPARISDAVPMGVR